ncbi:MAG: reverse transcriptase domain-containing protein [Alphaproteobacteria bacterium]|nr:reverse transcriptase domain-containing protein [Alphaproteobacteria bacterium]
MKIGIEQLLAKNALPHLLRHLRLFALTVGGTEAHAQFLKDQDQVRVVMQAGLGRLKKLRMNRSRGKRWCQAETMRMFQSRNFLTAVALIQALIKEQHLSLAGARHLADRARDWSVGEAIIFEPQPKSNGDQRIISKFGPMKRVRNRAMALLIEAVSGPFQFDFCHLGRGGVEGAVKQIGESVLQGYRFWITCDLTSAYPSVTLDHVKGIIPIHGRLLSEVGFSTRYNGYTTNKEGARPGLAEGASHSSKILSAFTDGPLRQVGGSVQVLCFADNIAIGARTLDSVECAFNTFKNALSASKAGPIHLHSVTICDAFHHHSHIKKGNLTYRNGVDFCQYRISYDEHDAKLRYRANTLAFAKAKRKAFSRLSGVNEEDEMEDIVDAYLRNWARSFRLWKVDDNTLECLKQTRDQWLYEFKYSKTIDAA